MKDALKGLVRPLIGLAIIGGVIYLGWNWLTGGGIGGGKPTAPYLTPLYKEAASAAAQAETTDYVGQVEDPPGSDQMRDEVARFLTTEVVNGIQVHKFAMLDREFENDMPAMRYTYGGTLGSMETQDKKEPGPVVAFVMHVWEGISGFPTLAVGLIILIVWPLGNRIEAGFRAFLIKSTETVNVTKLKGVVRQRNGRTKEVELGEAAFGITSYLHPDTNVQKEMGRYGGMPWVISQWEATLQSELGKVTSGLTSEQIERRLKHWKARGVKWPVTGRIVTEVKLLRTNLTSTQELIGRMSEMGEAASAFMDASGFTKGGLGGVLAYAVAVLARIFGKEET